MNSDRTPKSKPKQKWKELAEYKKRHTHHTSFVHELQRQEIQRQAMMRQGRMDPHSCPGCEA